MENTMKIGDDTMKAMQGNRNVCRSIMNSALVGLLLLHVGCAATATTRNPDSPFEAVSTPDSGPPMLKLMNADIIEANVNCSGESVQSIAIPPGEQREVRLPAGQYSCILSGGDATPHTWSETYEADTVYRVTLYTKQTVRL
jgi:hypothetical protein